MLYLSLQHDGTTIDSAEQKFPYAKVDLFQTKKKKKKKKYSKYLLARTYVYIVR